MKNSNSDHSGVQHNASVGALILGALGVVFGDIGTSPLYTINELNNHAHVQGKLELVLGILSLIFWALVPIMCIKYPGFVLRADNNGEGGTFALLNILKQYKGRLVVLLTGTLLVFAASNLLGEGALTPAISVLSAWEGTKPITEWFTETKVIIATCITLTVLFAVQKRGTEKIGKIFGPWMVLWFVAIAICGGLQVVKHPEVIQAVNPLHAYHFLVHEWSAAKEALLGLFAIFAIMGSVTLSFTGGEALYADLGHFNAKAIRWAWVLIFPCLLLNYFGQGARLLDAEPLLGRKVVEGKVTEEGNVFFSIVPGGQLGLVLMVIVAVGATVIASQALISGAFSICRGAINLGLMPRMKVVNTSDSHEGQIYMPFVNWTLYIICLGLVIWKGSSTNLAAAYGMAVTSVMLTTSLSMVAVAHHHWKWPFWAAVATFSVPFLIDLVFVSANAMKFKDGGYIPVTMGAILYLVMSTWRWGRAKISAAYSSKTTKTLKDLIDAMTDEDVQDLKLSAVVMTSLPLNSEEARIPVPLDNFWASHGGALPKNIVFLHLKQEPVPVVEEGKRYTVQYFFGKPEEDGPKSIRMMRRSVISIVASYGWTEKQNVRELLKSLREDGILPVNQEKWKVLVGEESLSSEGGGLWFNFRIGLFTVLQKVSPRAHVYFGLESDGQVQPTYVPIKITPDGQSVLDVSAEANPYKRVVTEA